MFYHPGTMAIDNPIDAFEQQNMMGGEPLLSTKLLAKFMGEIGAKLAFPDGGLALEILLKVADALFNKESGLEHLTNPFLPGLFVEKGIRYLQQNLECQAAIREG